MVMVDVCPVYPPNGGGMPFCLWPLKALMGDSTLVETQWHQALSAPCLGEAFLLLPGFCGVPVLAELQPPGQAQ
jgi:hypothetical protein